MDNKLSCTFKSAKQYSLDYYKSISVVKLVRYTGILFIPYSVVCTLLFAFMHQYKYIPLSLLLLVFMMFAVFGYVPLLRKFHHNDAVKRYGEDKFENNIIFDDEEIIVACKKDRTCIPYTSIKKISDCSGIYVLHISSMSGTYFVKGSGNNLSDDVILDFLKSKTGISAISNDCKKRKNTEIALFVVSTVASAAFLALICLALGS